MLFLVVDTCSCAVNNRVYIIGCTYVVFLVICTSLVFPSIILCGVIFKNKEPVSALALLNYLTVIFLVIERNQVVILVEFCSVEFRVN